MSSEEKPESRMSRWSRRKLDNAPQEIEGPISTELSDEELAAREAEELQLIANREAAEAVDLETADKETDFTVFMKSGVPAALKRRAFSVLWRSDPVLANLDELLDYGENFADPALNMEVFKSAWQIGKGYIERDEDGNIIEDAPDEEIAQEVEGEPDEEPDAISDEAVEDETLIADADEETLDHGVGSDIDVVEVEPEAIPKVSLRRRLALDSGVETT